MAVWDMSRTECLSALRKVGIGRVAISSNALPAIIPVNFVLMGAGILFGVMDGSPLAEATRQAVVAFQADAYDARTSSGWSVMVQGHARWITDPDELSRVRAVLPVPWVNGHIPEQAIRIWTNRVTGHRVQPV